MVKKDGNYAVYITFNGLSKKKKNYIFNSLVQFFFIEIIQR